MKTNSRTSVAIFVTANDLAYRDPTSTIDCPVFHALKRAGLNPLNVFFDEAQIVVDHTSFIVRFPDFVRENINRKYHGDDVEPYSFNITVPTAALNNKVADEDTVTTSRAAHTVVTITPNTPKRLLFKMGDYTCVADEIYIYSADSSWVNVASGAIVMAFEHEVKLLNDTIVTLDIP